MNTGKPGVDVRLKFEGYCRACDETGCVEWIGGYGGNERRQPIFHLPGTRQCKRSMPAYKAAWLLAGHKIPAGKIIFRKCLNTRCVSLAHLACGTHREMWDLHIASGKHRGQPRRIAANRRTTAALATPRETVAEVEVLLQGGQRCKDIATQLQISLDVVTAVRQGRHFHAVASQRVVRGASIFAGALL